MTTCFYQRRTVHKDDPGAPVLQHIPDVPPTAALPPVPQSAGESKREIIEAKYWNKERWRYYFILDFMFSCRDLHVSVIIVRGSDM